jgi:hypothetical protein
MPTEMIPHRGKETGLEPNQAEFIGEPQQPIALRLRHDFAVPPETRSSIATILPPWPFETP